MGRKEDLEQHIHDSYDLIREYEDLLRLSSDPKEKTRARRAIEEQHQLIQGWSKEYEQLTGQVVPDQLTERVELLDSEEKETDPKAPKRQTESERSIPKSGYFFLVLLLADLFVALILGWQWFGDQPELLAYLQVVTGFLALGLEILLLGIVLQQKMSLTDILHWLGINRLWQGIITGVTLILWAVLLGPLIINPASQQALQPAKTPFPPNPTGAAVVGKTLPVTITTQSTPWRLCQIESFEPQPPSPQPVGSLIIFKIRGTCESGVRAIRLQINGKPHGEKGGHEAPPEEFIPTWSTKGLTPGAYRVVVEVATWGDDEWEFGASQTLTYTLVASSTIKNNP